MLFKKKKHEIFNHLTIPPKPWGNRIIIPASGIIAAGWTNENKAFLLSSDGYSISDSITGEIEIRNKDENNSVMNKFSADNLEFEIEELNQRIKVFGLRGGNGNHITSDNWNLDSFHPYIGEQIVGIRDFKEKQNKSQYWQNFNLIKLERLENFTLTYGFSPNEKHFGVFGSGGAEIFSRK